MQECIAIDESRKGAIYSLVYLGILIHVLKILLQECITIDEGRKGAIYNVRIALPHAKSNCNTAGPNFISNAQSCSKKFCCRIPTFVHYGP